MTTVDMDQEEAEASSDGHGETRTSRMRMGRKKNICTSISISINKHQHQQAASANRQHPAVSHQRRRCRQNNDTGLAPAQANNMRQATTAVAAESLGTAKRFQYADDRRGGVLLYGLGGGSLRVGAESRNE